MKKQMLANLQPLPAKVALDVITTERDNLRNEVASLRSQLSQKDSVISSLNTQANEATTWKGYYNSAQSQVQGLQSQIQSLNAMISQKNSEIQSLKTQNEQKDREITNHSKYVKDITDSKLEAKSLKEKFDAQEQDMLAKDELIKNYNVNNSRLKEELVKTLQEFEELKNSFTEKADKISELQNNLIATNANLDFMKKLFDESKQEKLELSKEVKKYKKSYVKEYDSSTSKSKEIEKLRQEISDMSMSRSKVDHDSSELDESLSGPFFGVRSTHKSFTVPGTQTTVSHFIDTQDIKNYIKSKEKAKVSIFQNILEPLGLEKNREFAEVQDKKLSGEGFELIDNDNV